MGTTVECSRGLARASRAAVKLHPLRARQLSFTNRLLSSRRTAPTSNLRLPVVRVHNATLLCLHNTLTDIAPHELQSPLQARDWYKACMHDRRGGFKMKITGFILCGLSALSTAQSHPSPSTRSQTAERFETCSEGCPTLCVLCKGWEA
jgi:hypothetical protein